MIRMPIGYGAQFLQSQSQLDVFDRPAGTAAWPQQLLAARQGPRRIQLHKRDGLRARPAPGLRRLAGCRQSRLGVGRRAAPFRVDRDLRRKRKRGAREAGAARVIDPSPLVHPLCDDVFDRRRTGRIQAHARLQRACPGRRRRLPDHHAVGRAGFLGDGVPGAGDAAQEPRGRLPAHSRRASLSRMGRPSASSMSAPARRRRCARTANASSRPAQ